MPTQEMKGNTTVGSFFLRRARTGICLALTVSSTVSSSAFGIDESYRSISPRGTVHATTVSSHGKFSPFAGKRTYHASLKDHELEEAVVQYAREYSLSPALVMAVIKAESNFNPIVISKAGAVGLMQLIPKTASQHGVQNLYDTRDNIAGGTKHLRYLLDRYHGDVQLAVAAYNAGERKVDRYHRIPPFKETRTYVRKVMGFYRDYEWVHSKRPLRLRKVRPLSSDLHG